MAHGVNLELLMMCCQDLVLIFVWWISAFASYASTSEDCCIFGKLLLLAAGGRRAEVPRIDCWAWTRQLEGAVVDIRQGIEQVLYGSHAGQGRTVIMGEVEDDVLRWMIKTLQ